MQGLFLVGTDTGVGKTTVAVGLVRLLRRQGHAVRIVKPVATGGDEDPRRLAAAAGETDLRAVTPWCFAAPAAPPVAARMEGTSLSLEELARAVRSRWRPGTGVIAEGVGGLLCPLTESETVADLANLLRLPLVVVARRSLGTLNHVLLSLEVARHRGLDVRGLIVSETSPPQGIAEETNIEELTKRIHVPLLAVLRHRPAGPDSEDISADLAATDWWGLMKRMG